MLLREGFWGGVGSSVLLPSQDVPSCPAGPHGERAGHGAGPGLLPAVAVMGGLELPDPAETTRLWPWSRGGDGMWMSPCGGTGDCHLLWMGMGTLGWGHGGGWLLGVPTPCWWYGVRAGGPVCNKGVRRAWCGAVMWGWGCVGGDHRQNSATQTPLPMLIMSHHGVPASCPPKMSPYEVPP